MKLLFSFFGRSILTVRSRGNNEWEVLIDKKPTTIQYRYMSNRAIPIHFSDSLTLFKLVGEEVLSKKDYHSGKGTDYLDQKVAQAIKKEMDKMQKNK